MNEISKTSNPEHDSLVSVLEWQFDEKTNEAVKRHYAEGFHTIAYGKGPWIEGKQGEHGMAFESRIAGELIMRHPDGRAITLDARKQREIHSMETGPRLIEEKVFENEDALQAHIAEWQINPGEPEPLAELVEQLPPSETTR